MMFEPEFFDIFGLIAFVFITVLSSWMLFKKKLPSKLFMRFLLIIGILGIIIDGAIVFVNYLK